MKVDIKTLMDNIKNGNISGNVRDNTIITISNTPGSGGDEIVEKLANRLNLEVFDKDIIKRFAEYSGADADIFRMVTENASAVTKDFWWNRLFGKKSIDNNVIRRYLTNIMYTLARSGNCVIVGRGGHIPLSDVATMRIRITGSKDKCIERIMASHDISLSAATDEYNHRVASSGKFVWDIFNSRLNDPINFDLVINTDRIKSFDYCTDMITTMIKHIKGK